MKPKPGECPERAVSEGEHFQREDFVGLEATLTLKAAKDDKGPLEYREVLQPWNNQRAIRTVVHFKETPRTLVLNHGNRKRLIAMFGTNNTKRWVGKKVTLYFDPSVKAAKGNTPGGIVIKEAKK